jgi:hypothetical protein
MATLSYIRLVAKAIHLRKMASVRSKLDRANKASPDISGTTPSGLGRVVGGVGGIHSIDRIPHNDLCHEAGSAERGCEPGAARDIAVAEVAAGPDGCAGEGVVGNRSANNAGTASDPALARRLDSGGEGAQGSPVQTAGRAVEGEPREKVGVSPRARPRPDARGNGEAGPVAEGHRGLDGQPQDMPRGLMADFDDRDSSACGGGSVDERDSAGAARSAGSAKGWDVLRAAVRDKETEDLEAICRAPVAEVKVEGWPRKVWRRVVEVWGAVKEEPRIGFRCVLSMQVVLD